MGWITLFNDQMNNSVVDLSISTGDGNSVITEDTNSLNIFCPAGISTGVSPINTDVLYTDMGSNLPNNVLRFSTSMKFNSPNPSYLTGVTNEVTLRLMEHSGGVSKTPAALLTLENGNATYYRLTYYDFFTDFPYVNASFSSFVIGSGTDLLIRFYWNKSGNYYYTLPETGAVLNPDNIAILFSEDGGVTWQTLTRNPYSFGGVSGLSELWRYLGLSGRKNETIGSEDLDISIDYLTVEHLPGGNEFNQQFSFTTEGAGPVVWAPTLGSVSPGDMSLNISKNTNISFSTYNQSPVLKPEHIYAEISYNSGLDWEVMYDGYGSGFQAGYNGAGSSITPSVSIDGYDGYEVVIDPENPFSYDAYVMCRITVYNPDYDE